MRSAALLLACCLIAAQPKADDPFTGEWKVVLASKQGKAVSDADLKEMRISFKDGVMGIHEGKEASNAKYTFDPAAKTITLEAEKGGAKCEGLYRFDLLTLKLAWSLPNRDRPKAIPEKPDAGLNLFTLQRLP